MAADAFSPPRQRMRDQPGRSGRKLTSVGPLAARHPFSVRSGQHGTTASMPPFAVRSVQRSSPRRSASWRRGAAIFWAEARRDPALDGTVYALRVLGRWRSKMTRSRWMNALMTGVVLGPVAVIAVLGADAPGAAETSLTLSPKALEEIAQVE